MAQRCHPQAYDSSNPSVDDIRAYVPNNETDMVLTVSVSPNRLKVAAEIMKGDLGIELEVFISILVQCITSSEHRNSTSWFASSDH